MADDNTIIEGTVKFRDGKKWKPRWCVMRRLSPVADSVQLQLYRDARARSRRLGRLAGGAGGREGGREVKASLSLQHYLGCEAGFTLDKHSNTLALICQDFVAVLAFETRERLLQWQVKVSGALGEARQWLVLVASGETGAGGAGGAAAAAVPAGPARLHLHERRAALTAGLPPRLLAVWEMQHLRRFGVVDGRFCLEGGSLCGAGAGLCVLVADAARDIAAAFERAVRTRLSPRRGTLRDRMNDGAQSPGSQREFRSVTRLSERIGSLAGEESHGESWTAAECGEDALSLSGAAGGVGGEGGVRWGEREAALARCVSCMSKLGALSRSSTVALTPGAKHFSPAWTMEALSERAQASTSCACDPPPRPPRPTRLPRLELTLSRKPNAGYACEPCGDRTRSGPYENYDVPKVPSTEVEGEYYDTPKRLKESIGDLFQITKSSTSNAVILKKPCGCLLKFGRRRREPTVVEAPEGSPRACPCRRVTDWANSWMRLPYCRRTDKENVTPNGDSREALYATVDFSRKTRSRTRDDATLTPDTPADAHHFEIDDGPLANYENLNFALSLEYYENARDLLRRVGVTQAELDAIGTSLRQPFTCGERCNSCGHERRRGTGDDYLTMTPGAREDGHERERDIAPPAGYTPMSPIGGFTFNSLRLPSRSPGGAGPLDEKSASNPTLCASDERTTTTSGLAAAAELIDRRKRSNSADSSRFLEDVEEYEAGGSASSLETLRNVETAGGRPGDACGCGAGAASDADSSERADSAGRRAAAGGAAAGNRDSSSSADSGVSSCPRELPATTHRYRAGRRSPPVTRRSRSTDVCSAGEDSTRGDHSHKSSSAEAEVPVLPIKSLRGVVDSRSTSSGTSDMSDYIETLSICSSHSSTDTPVTLRMCGGGAQTSTLRPRSGAEYRAAPRLAPARAAHAAKCAQPARIPHPARNTHPPHPSHPTQPSPATSLHSDTTNTYAYNIPT